MQKTMKPAAKKKEEGLVAVIVGIDGYKKKPLNCAVNDAVYLTETLQKVWQDREFKIKTLIWPSLDEEKVENQIETWGFELPEDAGQVTRDGILSIVREYAGLARERDTFLFYFAGHGVLTDREPVLVTAADDSSPGKVEYIKVKEIQQAAAGCASRQKVMILDCCQAPERKNKPAKGYKNLAELTRDWAILLSSSPGEVSLEDQYFGDNRDDYLQQGVFTASLAEGLRGEAAGSSGSVSLVDLAYFVGKRVPVEYLARLEALVLSRRSAQDQTDTRGRGLSSQNPVLLSPAAAMGGPYQVTIAPVPVSTSQEARRKIPSKDFLKYWFKFLFVKWPIRFPFRLLFQLGAFVYAAAMVLTVLLHYPGSPDNNTILMFLGGVGLGSILVWWLTLPFAVAVNEDRWHPGGYLTLLFYLLWHCIVALGFARVFGTEQITNTGINRFIYVVVELFLIYGVVVVFNCNTSQVIIALAELIRPGDRREIRQAIRVFQQFRYKIFGVDLYNFVPNISFRPDFYLYVCLISLAIIGLNTGIVMVTQQDETVQIWVFLMRNICAAIMVIWLVLWYHSAFKFIQRQVYKR